MRPRDDTPPLREMIAGLVDAGKTYARAEIAYYQALVTVRAKAAAIGVGFAVAALLIAQAALTVLLAALGLLVARWLGGAGGFAIAALVGLLLAGLLAFVGVRRIAGSGDAT